MVTTVVVIPAFVARLIFRGPDEVHRPVAGMIFMAVLTPVMSVLRRNVQINGRRRNRVRYRLDRHRLSVQHRWRPFIAQLTPQSDRKASAPKSLSAPAEEAKVISADFLFYTLGQLRPLDSIIVQESLSNLKELRKRLPTSKSRSFFSMTSGVLGYALPAAVGIALSERDQGKNRKVICLVGDGAAQYAIQGLWTAAQLNLPILFILVRNVEYAILKSFAEKQGTPRVPGLDLPGLDGVKLAEGYGCWAGRVSKPDSLLDALRDSLAKTSPHLLEVVIDPKVPPLI